MFFNRGIKVDRGAQAEKELRIDKDISFLCALKCICMIRVYELKLQVVSKT